MTTFLLVRHGAADPVGRRIMGWSPGIHVNAEGRSEIEALAAMLAGVNIAAVYSSPLERAVDTASAIARQCGVDVIRDEAFGEVRFGDWTGRDLEELERDERWRRWNAVRSMVRAPGGETMIEIQARFIEGLSRLRSEHKEQTVVVVSHGDPIRAALAYLAGMPLDFMLRLRIDTASVSVVRLGDWGPELMGMNIRAAGWSWMNQTSARS